MADDNPPVSEGTTQSRRPLNMDEANVSNVKVTRMDVNTGEIKELQTDLLREICDCIEASSGDMAKTLRDEIRASKAVLKKTLQENRAAITKAIERTGGSGSGGRTGGSGTNDVIQEMKTVEEELKGIIETFNNGLQQITDAMIVAAEQQRISSAQGENQIDAQGRSISEVLETTDNLRDFNSIINNESIPAFEKASQLISSGFSAQREQIMNSVWLSVQSFGAELTDVRDIMRNFGRISRSVADTFDIAQTGIADTSDIIIDSFKQLGRVVGAFATDDMESLRDSIRRTGQFIVGQAAEGRGTQFLLEGSKNIEDAAKFLRDTRNQINEEFNFRRFMSDEEANVAILELLEVQKRAGIQGEISTSELTKRFIDQNTFLSKIARDSGLSLEQLRKMTEEDRKQLANLEAISVLNNEQKRAFENLQTRAEAAGSPELKLLINQLAQSGNDMSAFAINFPNEFEDILKLGLQPQLRELSNLINQRDELGPQEFNRRFENLTQTMQEVAKQRTDELGPIVKIRDFFKTDVSRLIGGLSRITRLDDTPTPPPDDDTAKSLFETAKDLFNQFFPGDEVGLVRALTANTAAIIANTIALVGGGGISRILSGISGLARRGTGAVSSIFRGSGSAATRGAAGIAGRGALGAAGSVAGAGLLGFELTRITGADKAINDMVVPGEGTIGTALANLFGADTTDPETQRRIDAEVAQIKARAEERKRAGDATARRTPTPANDPAMAHLSTQVEKLTAIEAILTTANDISTQIRDIIGQAGALSRVGDVTGPSPVQRKVPSLDSEVQAFETAVDVSP